MAYCLLTGATGFLGRYLLKDLLLASVPVAVLVRGSKRETARQRIEAVMGYWEQRLRRALPRPVVLQGDVREVNAGLSEADVRWLGANCDTLIHSAASMNFHASSPQGEPFHSNITGTSNLLQLCRRASIRRLHQVSTAYVCGLRTGRILETELDLGQQNGNDYERSKLAAEKLVRSADFVESATFYRPASVIGDSQTGYTTNYHGFYAPLQLAYSMVKGLVGKGAEGKQQIVDTINRARFLGRLNMRGNEGKNLVPVDWVSAIITHVFLRSELHGRTYHLTPRNRVDVQTVSEVFEEALGRYAGISFEAASTVKEDRNSQTSELFERFFREQLSVYESHFRDDPVFDYTNTAAAAPNLPCPHVDRDMLVRTTSFAVDSNFGWPRPAPTQIEFDAQDHLASLLEAGARQDAPLLGLQISGPGGGQWRLSVDQGSPVAAEAGVEPACVATYYLNVKTFANLARGRLSAEQALNSGRLVIEGNTFSDQELVQILQRVATPTAP